ncbi:hypothetical protein [Lactiplantibacillus plantarum]|uniref:hypothetical protein n=1 Tax=Lactiplantibacillus plantarum TaxID=1590 RepID=UPI00117B4451|nr:hypothetical protein [Lactiplantibacillus plantarum]
MKRQITPKLRNIMASLDGLTYSEWKQLEGAIDFAFSQKIAKLHLDDSEDTKQALRCTIISPRLVSALEKSDS